MRKPLAIPLETFLNIFKYSQQAIVIFRRKNQVIIEANDRFLTRFGYAWSEVQGRTIGSLDLWSLESGGADIEEIFSSNSLVEKTLQLSGMEKPTTFHLAAESISYNDESYRVLIIGEVIRQKNYERDLLKIMESEQYKFARNINEILEEHLMRIAHQCAAMKSSMRELSLEGDIQMEELYCYINEAIRHTKRAVKSISPVGEGKSGFIGAFEELAISIQNMFGINCFFEHEYPLHIDRFLEINLYCIAKEAIQNAIIHGSANSIVIRLAATESSIELTVKDDGVGLPDDHSMKEGLGIHVMKCRSYIIDGSFSISNNRDKGAMVICRVNLQESRNTAIHRIRDDDSPEMSRIWPLTTAQYPHQNTRGLEILSTPIKLLNDRELQVFQMIGEGMKSKEIAEHFLVSVKTIESIRKNIREKFKIKTANSLIRYAIEWNRLDDQRKKTMMTGA